MTPEVFFIQYLERALPAVTVVADVPDKGGEPSQDFLTVELVGASVKDQVSVATLAIDSWSTTRAKAMDLSAEVKDVMFKALEEPEVSFVELNTEYNNPRLSTRHPRYRTMWRVTYVSLTE
ncbi:MAG: hypothetical protein IKG25_05805 [Mogibacterium sp.]|nr:hypothetical protein [Mogibacterium sp.]MBR4090409.1 hypothetical protein [Mogibacterium sp.]